jgi:hypothetical protein
MYGSRPALRWHTIIVSGPQAAQQNSGRSTDHNRRRASRDGPPDAQTTRRDRFVLAARIAKLHFGFQLDFQGPPDDVYHGHVSRDGAGVMLKTILPDVLPVPNHVRHEWARWDAYIYTLAANRISVES